MPDPFAPQPCQDCGKELTYKVLEAGDFLYGGGSVGEGINLADKVAEYMAEEPKRRARGEHPSDDVTLVGQALSWMLDYIEPSAFAAAVRHWGHVDQQNDSECERIRAAQWCHEPTPEHGGVEDSRPFECTLEAGHEGAHRFDYEPALAR